jgi:hypothetical protein
MKNVMGGCQLCREHSCRSSKWADGQTLILLLDPDKNVEYWNWDERHDRIEWQRIRMGKYRDSCSERGCSPVMIS